MVQSGPLAVINGVITIINDNPRYPFIRPFIGVTTPFETGRGPSCRGELECLSQMDAESTWRDDTVDGRNPANQLRLVVYPIIIYKVLYIPVGAGFLPSTVRI